MKFDLMEDFWMKKHLRKKIEIKSHEYPLKKATYKEKNIRADVFAFLEKMSF